MEHPETYIKKKPGIKKTTKILMYIIAAMLIATYVILLYIPPIIPDWVFIALTTLILTDLIIVVLFSIKYYNIGISFIVLIVIAIFFRRMRWMGTGYLFTFGFIGLVCYSLYLSRVFLKRFNHISFMKYIGFSSSIVLSVVSIGLLTKNMHWPLAGVILPVGLIMFIPFLFAFVFTLPNSDYVNWTRGEKTLFFRGILIPMGFVYILCVLMFVLPDIWTDITRQPVLPFNMSDFELFNVPGI